MGILLLLISAVAVAADTVNFCCCCYFSAAAAATAAPIRTPSMPARAYFFGGISPAITYQTCPARPSVPLFALFSCPPVPLTPPHPFESIAHTHTHTCTH